MSTDLTTKRVLVTGGTGFLGRAVCRKLAQRGVQNVLVPRHEDYDLTREADVARLYDDMQPQVVLHLAAEVGGIGANMINPGRFFFANMAMSLHLIEYARQHKLEKFVQIGTICSYPRHTQVPFREEDLWDGYPEQTNAPYGVAKKAALVMLDGYHRQYALKSAYLMPVNMFGPGDNFDLTTSHVIPALIRKCIEAVERGDRTVRCWGTGRVTREFLYVDDAAEGIIVAAQKIDEPTPINLGTGNEIEVRELAELIADFCEFKGRLLWDPAKPDGQPRRCVDTHRAKSLLGWKRRFGFEDALQRTIDWFKANRAEAENAPQKPVAT